jgi:hypothetical protein
VARKINLPAICCSEKLLQVNQMIRKMPVSVAKRKMKIMSTIITTENVPLKQVLPIS